MQNSKLSAISLSYLAVVLIWSTTPLAIKWSSEGAGFIFGVFSRMAIGAILGLALLAFLKHKLPLDKSALKVYLAASLSIFGSMQLVYWGALYIPSGLIAVIFGFAPMLTSVLSNRWLPEKKTSHLQWLALLLSLSGLFIIFYDDFSGQTPALKGILAVTLSVILHSSSAVVIKFMKVPMSGVSVAIGGLLVSLPLFTMVWLIAGTPVPAEFSLKAGLSIVYLGCMGSVVGFMLYYYLLRELKASTVALITLITPVTALMLGMFLNNEIITTSLMTGVVLVMLGLIIYQWGNKLIRRLT